MPLEEPEPLQVLIKGMNLRQMLDDRFLGIMQKELKNPKIFSISIAQETDEDEEWELISLSHPDPKSEDDKKIVIDVKFTESIDKMQSILKTFDKKQGDTQNSR